MPISYNFFQNILNHMPISYSLFKNSLKDLPLTNYITKKDSEIQTNAEKEQYKNTGFSPLSTKE